MYISYRLTARGQAANSNLNNILFWQQSSCHSSRLLSFFRSGVAFGSRTKSLVRYVNSAKTLSRVNYISYWSKFWRLRRCLLIWVPLPVPTWTPYSVKVFSFLIPIVLFSIEIVIVLPFTTCIQLFIYLFHFIFAFFFIYFLFLFSRLLNLELCTYL